MISAGIHGLGSKPAAYRKGHDGMWNDQRRELRWPRLDTTRLLLGTQSRFSRSPRTYDWKNIKPHTIHPFLQPHPHLYLR